jgi:hypothetical protein
MPKGGRRPGAGRPIGAASRKTREKADAAAAAGLDPMTYLLNVLADEKAEVHRRDAAARDLMPYCHPKLMALTPRNDTSPNGDLYVTTINVTPVPSGHDADGRPFDFTQPKLISPLSAVVEVEEIVEEIEAEPTAPNGPLD